MKFMFFRKEVRIGDLTSTQIIMVVMIVIGFVLISYFLWRAILSNEASYDIDRQVCINSILQRHSFNIGPFEPGRELIPLKCETIKTCVATRKTKKECEEFFGKSSKENKVIILELSGNEEKIRNDVMDRISEALINCHTLVGKGELNFMPSHIFKEDYCLPCERIALTSDVYPYVKNIRLYDFYKYLDDKPFNGEKSYLEELYGFESVEDFLFITQGLDESQKKKYNFFKDQYLNGEEFDFTKLKLFDEEEVVVMTKMSVSGYISPAVVSTTFGLGVGIITFYFLGPAAIPLSIKLAVGSGIISYSFGRHVQDGKIYYPPQIYPYNAEKLKILQCSSYNFLK